MLLEVLGSYVIAHTYAMDKNPQSSITPPEIPQLQLQGQDPAPASQKPGQRPQGRTGCNVKEGGTEELGRQPDTQENGSEPSPTCSEASPT